MGTGIGLIVLLLIIYAAYGIGAWLDRGRYISAAERDQSFSQAYYDAQAARAASLSNEYKVLKRPV